MADELEQLREAVELYFLVEEGVPVGADHDLDHFFEHTTDGDGWNEPFSVSAHCSCGAWSSDWVQTDPQQTGRPDRADLLLAWRGHIVSLTPQHGELPSI